MTKNIPDLTSDRLRLRAPKPSDVPAFESILAQPIVARWWPRYNKSRIENELITHDDDLHVWTIEFNSEVVGAIQFSEITDPDYRCASVDIFISESVHGMAIGPEAIARVLNYLFDDRGHHRVTIDPAEANTKAIRAYEKVGFRQVGILRKYERGLDGSWHNGVLMELLAEDFVVPQQWQTTVT